MKPLKVFQKLNLKDQREIVVVNAPPSFEPELGALVGVAVVREPTETRSIRFALGFATRQSEVDQLSKHFVDRSEGDALIWLAYPKGTSKNHRCEFNRDTGWSVLRAARFDTVRQIAIDDDWAALRFRRIEFIRNTTRPR